MTRADSPVYNRATMRTACHVRIQHCRTDAEFPAMNATSASQLFQSDHSLRVGQERADKAARTAHGEQHGWPVWLGASTACPLPAPSASADADARPIARDVSEIAAKAGGADGGSVKVLAAHQTSRQSRSLWTGESGHIVRQVDLEVSRAQCGSDASAV